MPLSRVEVLRSKSSDTRLKKARTKVTNRTKLLENIDGRTKRARRIKDIEKGLIADQGGLEKVPEIKLHLIRQYAETAVRAEERTAAFIRGEDINHAEAAQDASTMVRLARQIGVGRVRKDSHLTPLDYIQGRHRQDEDDE